MFTDLLIVELNLEHILIYKYMVSPLYLMKLICIIIKSIKLINKLIKINYISINIILKHYNYK